MYSFPILFKDFFIYLKGRVMTVAARNKGTGRFFSLLAHSPDEHIGQQSSFWVYCLCGRDPSTWVPAFPNALAGNWFESWAARTWISILIWGVSLAGIGLIYCTTILLPYYAFPTKFLKIPSYTSLRERAGLETIASCLWFLKPADLC